MPGGIDNDLESLPNRLVYDMAGTVRNVKVYLGGLHLKLNFEKHCSMYAKAIARGREVERESDPRGLKGHALKLNHIRNHIFIFVNCLVNNPAFSSQTKEQLTTKAAQFGSKCEFTDKFLKRITNTVQCPSLLKIPSFFQEFITPGIKVEDILEEFYQFRTEIYTK
ncbi:hypothetical protein F4860DRAFT_511068 [Xylaria cubensis]|nr:hypothetical protein F4860DRAFT_511068 [Xylaria cubensis]